MERGRLVLLTYIKTATTPTPLPLPLLPLSTLSSPPPFLDTNPTSRLFHSIECTIAAATAADIADAAAASAVSAASLKTTPHPPLHFGPSVFAPRVTARKIMLVDHTPPPFYIRGTAQIV